MKVGVFDSGIGGLTVLKELLKKFPNEEYIYVGDSYHLPYGEKTKEELLQLSSNIVDFLVEQGVDLIVIACGTVSSNVYMELKQKYRVPIFDIITPTIDYLKKHYERIGIMATPMTIQSGVFWKVLPDLMVIEQDCPLFVPYIESGKFNDNGLLESIDVCLQPMINNHVEAIVLGCTHYPIIEKQIASRCSDFEFINMGTILADSLKIPEGHFSLDIYFSKITPTIVENVKYILSNDVDYTVKEWLTYE